MRRTVSSAVPTSRFGFCFSVLVRAVIGDFDAAEVCSFLFLQLEWNAVAGHWPSYVHVPTFCLVPTSHITSDECAQIRVHTYARNLADRSGLGVNVTSATICVGITCKGWRARNLGGASIWVGEAVVLNGGAWGSMVKWQRQATTEHATPRDLDSRTSHH